MNYKIQFLDDESFESLPGENMARKVGVAYPESGEAYVRKSGSKVLDIFTAMHELQHLEGESLSEHLDEINHCYYKGDTNPPTDKPSAAWWNPFGGNFLGPAHDYILPAAEVGAAFTPLGPLGSAAIGGIHGATAKGETNYDTGVKGQRGDLGRGFQEGLQGYGIGSLAQGVGNMFQGAPNVIPTNGGGYEANAGRMAAEVGGNGIGSGTAAGSAAASGYGGVGASSLFDQLGNSLSQNATNSLFGGQQSPMAQFQMPDNMGSFNPQVNQSPGANVIPGQSGSGVGGGGGGAPGGSIGGGAVSKLKAYLQQQGQGPSAMSAFGGA